MKHVLLYFGSFNPVHKGHIALAEYAIDKGLCDEVVLIVSPQNPLKESEELAPELDRFEMAELACAASRYPQQIKPSAVEFLLERPSYTIQTLRFLTQNHGHEMRFSILMGADLTEQLDRWKDYNEILEHYPIYVYPRRGEACERYRDRVTYLADAPLCDYSSTEVRAASERGEQIEPMVGSEVAAYIQRKKLWDPTARLEKLTELIDGGRHEVALYVERGKLHYRRAEWGKALNDFNAALRLEPDHIEAREWADMAQEILTFRYKDYYNP